MSSIAVNMSHVPSIAVYKIDRTDPNFERYVTKLKENDKTDYIRITNKGKYRPFCAIYCGEKFLGAASIVLKRKLNKENKKVLCASVKTLNWSNDGYDLTGGYPKLHDIARQMCEDKLIRENEELEYDIDIKPPKILFENKA